MFQQLNFQKFSEPVSFFYTCHFEIFFAPQQHELFHHLNFEKCSEHEVFSAFWLRIQLRGTTACNFSFLIWPDSSAPAALASLLFDPPEPQNIGKHSIHDFGTFSRPCIFFLLTLSLLWSSFSFSSLLFPSLLFSSSLFWFFPSLLCHVSMLSEVWLLNFRRYFFFWVAIAFIATWVAASNQNSCGSNKQSYAAWPEWWELDLGIWAPK